jgi:hypothetical protein
MKIVIFRPGQGLLPHTPIVGTADRLRGASALVVDSSIPFIQVHDTLKALLGDVDLQLYDLRDQ